MTDQEKQIAYENEEKRIAATISDIKHRIAVFSGKGGVGKTTVSVNLAYSFQLEGFSTGILDADITGPNVPKMLGIGGEVIVLNEVMVPFEKYGLKMMSIDALIKPGQAVIWRGPMRSKVINQFLADVEWGQLDYLIADLPPGTGDEILTIAQQMKPDVAIIVTTPQEVSIIDAERSVNMAMQLGIPYIGIVENMAGYVCPHCSAVVELFGAGGGRKLADKHNLPFLGSIPITLNTRISGDSGKPVVLENPESEVTSIFKSIVNTITEHYQEKLKK